MWLGTSLNIPHLLLIPAKFSIDVHTEPIFLYLGNLFVLILFLKAWFNRGCPFIFSFKHWTGNRNRCKHVRFKMQLKRTIPNMVTWLHEFNYLWWIKGSLRYRQDVRSSELHVLLWVGFWKVQVQLPWVREELGSRADTCSFMGTTRKGKIGIRPWKNCQFDLIWYPNIIIIQQMKVMISAKWVRATCQIMTMKRRPSEQPTFVNRAFCGIKFGQIRVVIIQNTYREWWRWEQSMAHANPPYKAEQESKKWSSFTHTNFPRLLIRPPQLPVCTKSHHFLTHTNQTWQSQREGHKSHSIFFSFVDSSTNRPLSLSVSR